MIKSSTQNTLFDPTALDKKFSYKDCEVNPNLAPTIASQLKALLKECKAAFAISKLDVGKFKEFTVQLEIDQEIQPEKQRVLSDEKLAYCDNTFAEFRETRPCARMPHTKHCFKSALSP
jgi:hypothetical protein